MSLGTLSDTVTATLTKRELTLIRVACLQRLDRLQKAQVGNYDTDELALLKKAYDETRALLDTGGVLYKAARDARLIAADATEGYDPANDRMQFPKPR